MMMTARSLTLSSLRSLTLFDVDDEIFDALINPVALPNLEEFAYINDDSYGAQMLEASDVDKLLPQLSVLVININVWRAYDAWFLHSAASRTLVDCPYEQLEQHPFEDSPIVNVQIYGVTFEDVGQEDASFSKTLSTFASYLQAKPSLPLRSIYFGLPSRFRSELSHEVRESMEYLAGVCERRSIDLVFETDVGEPNLDLHVSAEFLRRQKEKRRIEQKE
jgi:hypothetical protein